MPQFAACCDKHGSWTTPTRPKGCFATSPSVSNETGRGRRLDPGRHRRNPHHHAPWIAEGAAALARLYQHHRECHEHGAARMPEREAMALGLDGDALDRGRHAGSGQRLPTTEGSQAASSVAGRSGSSSQQKLTRRPCSPDHRRLTSISAATASQCSTKSGTSPVADQARQNPFDVYEYVSSLLAGFPPEASVMLLLELIASEKPVIDQAVAGFGVAP